MRPYTLELADASYNGQKVKPMLLWTDPPYGTGKVQKQGPRQYRDVEDTTYVMNAVRSWLPVLHRNATVCICCDYRLAPSMIVSLLGEGWFYRGEVVWEFGLGRPRTSWWPVRHNNILTFTRTERSGLFDPTAIPRAKRLAPKPGYSDDKPSGSVWEFTMSNTHPQRVKYPNQKPLEIIEPFVLAHTKPRDTVLDIFSGSGSTGVAAIKNRRFYYGVDSNTDAIEISEQRLKNASSASKSAGKKRVVRRSR